MEKRILVNDNNVKKMYNLDEFKKKYSQEPYPSPCFVNGEKGDPEHMEIITLEETAVMYNAQERMFYYIFNQGMGQIQVIPQSHPGIIPSKEEAQDIINNEYKKIEGRCDLYYNGRLIKKGISTAKSYSMEEYEKKFGKLETK